MEKNLIRSVYTFFFLPNKNVIWLCVTNALICVLQLAEVREVMEAEMRTQLRRQAAAHMDHVQDVLKVQEQELKADAEQVRLDAGRQQLHQHDVSHICLDMYVCMHGCMYVCRYVCMCISMSILLYTHTHILSSTSSNTDCGLNRI